MMHSGYLKMKSTASGMAPILKLPDDILCDLFIIISSQERNETDYSRAWFRKHRSIVLTRICRKWRNVALDLPLLWNYIVMPEFTIEQVKEYVLRSREAPLTVFVNYERMQNSPSAPNYLQAIAGQISKITTWGMRAELLSRDLAHLPFSLHNASHINTLILESTNIELRPTPLEINSEHFPRLQILRLVRAFPIPSQISLKHLRCLVLQEQLLDMSELTSILSGCSEALEELEIRGICAREMLMDYEVDDLIPVALGRLKQLILDRNFCPLSKLLRCLEFRTSLSWKISMNVNAVEGLQRVLHQLPTPLYDHSIMITVNKSQLYVGSHPPDLLNCDSDFTGRSLYACDSHCGPMVNVFLREVARILPPDTSVLRIGFENIGDFPVERDVLFSILSRMPAVDTLIIERTGYENHLRSVQTDLLRALTTLNTDKDDRQRICCPELLHLEIVEFDFTDSEEGLFADKLLESLIRRKDLGYPLLGLHIKDALNLSGEIIKRLHGIADGLYIDGRLEIV